jgi:cell division septal protein FtsQ
MSVPIRNRQTLHDTVARAHRRAGMMRATGIGVALLIVFGVLGWLFLFTSVLAITDIRVSGAQSIGDGRILGTVEELLDRRTLQLLQPSRNIILLDTAAVASSLQRQYENIETVTVRKVFPHALEVTISERVAFGLWCRDQQCTYFDRSGTQWGSAVPSHGPLLVRVQDERTDSEVPERLVQGMLAALDGLPDIGLRGLTVTLPDSVPGDMKIRVDKKYDLLMDAYGDISDQLSTLGVLLSDRAKDASWAPVYIDLRTPGRAYFR